MRRQGDFLPASRLGLTMVVVLYLAHALPLYFYNVALPAILRSKGVDLRWIGLLSLLYIPWAFKFLWAPLIDRCYLSALGRRRTWLWATQAALVVGLLALALTALDHGLLAFVLIGLWISTMAATQDIAIDGYTVESLAPADHRLGSMAQSMGVALGSMIGGAGVLWLHQLFGWRPALLALSTLVALTMLAVRWMDERGAPASDAPRPSFVHTLRRPEMLWAFLLILVYRLVEAPAMAMLNPLLIDHGWSLTGIGLLMSVAGAIVGLLAAIAAAGALKWHTPQRLLLGAGWLRTLVYLLLAALLYGGLAGTSELWLGGLVLLILAVRYLAMTSLYALFMRLSSRQQAGTDFTMLVCLELLVYFLGGAASGFLAKGMGYEAYYLLLGVLSVFSVLLSRWVVGRLETAFSHS